MNLGRYRGRIPYRFHMSTIRALNIKKKAHLQLFISKTYHGKAFTTIQFRLRPPKPNKLKAFAENNMGALRYPTRPGHF